jgi:hypothetical protein
MSASTFGAALSGCNEAPPPGAGSKPATSESQIVAETRRGRFRASPYRSLSELAVGQSSGCCSQMNRKSLWSITAPLLKAMISLWPSRPEWICH